MTQFNIYQVNLDRDNNDIAFMPYFMNEDKIDHYAYDVVYSAKMKFENLEQIFEVFNLARPEDYKGRSLSVSDIVEIVWSDTMDRGLYYVDDIGFEKIDKTKFFKEKMYYDADMIDELLKKMLNDMAEIDAKKDTGRAWKKGVIDAVKNIQATIEGAKKNK